MKPLHIAFEAAAMEADRPTGIGRYAASITQAMMRQHPEVQYEMLRLSPSQRLLGAVCERESAADVTHFFNDLVPKGIKGKTVVTVHDMVLHACPETMRCRTRLLLAAHLRDSMARADRIVTDSFFSAAEIAAYYPQFAKKTRVVYCGVDHKRFHPITHPAVIRKVKHRHGIAGPYLLYAGTLEPRKNLVRLIQAYRLLYRQQPQIPKLVLAGAKGWKYREIFQAAKPLLPQGQILFAEYVPDEDLAAFYAGAECFVFPSLYEGFGLPPLEAMACGTPVMISRAASLPEICGSAALQCDPYSVKSIADAMDTLLHDAPLRQKLRRKGLARAARFTWEIAAMRLYAIDMQLLKGDAPL